MTDLPEKKGLHPSADKRFRPHLKKIDLIREALQPFGLDKDDEETWFAIRPSIVALAHGYNFRRTPGAVPRPGRVRSSFDNVEQAFGDLKKTAGALVEAIGAVDDVALEWMLAYDDPISLFARNRIGTAGPSTAPEAFKERAKAVFGPELEEWSELTARQSAEFVSAAQPLVEERDAAMNAFRSTTLEHIRLTTEQLPELFFPLTPPPTAAKRMAKKSAALAGANKTALHVQQELSEKARALALASLRIGRFIPPSPHFARSGLQRRMHASLDELLRQFSPIADLVIEARRRFDNASPTDKGGNNLSSFLLGKSPKERLAEECCELIFFVFGSAGLKTIKATKERGDFVALLRAMHEFATGAEGEDFSDALKQVVTKREELLRGGLSAPIPSAKNPKAAAQKAAKKRETDLQAAHARLKRGAAHPKGKARS